MYMHRFYSCLFVTGRVTEKKQYGTEKFKWRQKLKWRQKYKWKKKQKQKQKQKERRKLKWKQIETETVTLLLNASQIRVIYIELQTLLISLDTSVNVPPFRKLLPNNF
jgi:hypothetical protein